MASPGLWGRALQYAPLRVRWRAVRACLARADRPAVLPRRPAPSRSRHAISCPSSAFPSYPVPDLMLPRVVRIKVVVALLVAGATFAWDVGLAPAELAVVLDRTVFHAGETVEATVAVHRHGPGLVVDVYAGALRPDGT